MREGYGQRPSVCPCAGGPCHERGSHDATAAKSRHEEADAGIVPLEEVEGDHHDRHFEHPQKQKRQRPDDEHRSCIPVGSQRVKTALELGHKAHALHRLDRPVGGESADGDRSQYVEHHGNRHSGFDPACGDHRGGDQWADQGSDVLHHSEDGIGRTQLFGLPGQVRDEGDRRRVDGRGQDDVERGEEIEDP
jgi:hypothetical protein